MPKYKSFAEALSATPTPIAANDNKPAKKRKEPRYRGTLPALRWLYDNHPGLAESIAVAVKELAVSNWNQESGDDYLEIRPLISEIIRAASDGEHADGTPKWLSPSIERDSDGKSFVQVGTLRFENGALIEYGRTRKDRKLEPREIARPREPLPSKERDPSRYLAGKPAASPLHAEPYQRPITTEPAIPPMYDPQRGVEENRAELRKHGVDGSVAFADLPLRATKCPTAIAKGAEFLGGVVGLSGTSSGGAVNMGDLPARQKGEVMRIVEAIASGATLKEIGERLGLRGVRLDRMAKDSIVDAARVLQAANDNNRKNIAA